MPAPTTVAALEQSRDHILAQLAAIGDMRPGSLVHRYMKCSTPSCRCHQEGEDGHGPYFLLVRHVDGKRTSRSLPAADAPTVEAQLAEYRRFRRLTAELVAVSEQLADARLLPHASAARSAGKKSPDRSQPQVSRSGEAGESRRPDGLLRVESLQPVETLSRTAGGTAIGHQGLLWLMCEGRKRWQGTPVLRRRSGRTDVAKSNCHSPSLECFVESVLRTAGSVL